MQHMSRLLDHMQRAPCRATLSLARNAGKPLTASLRQPLHLVAPPVIDAAKEGNSRSSSSSSFNLRRPSAVQRCTETRIHREQREMRLWPWCLHRRHKSRASNLSATEGNLILRHIAERSSQPLNKCSLEELMELSSLTPKERLRHLERVLHIGISKIILVLQDMPLGFGSVGPIKSVIQDYVQDVKDLRQCPSKDTEAFHSCILGIFRRHRGMMSQIAAGLTDFQHELKIGFAPFGDLEPTNCADAVEQVRAMQKIERGLDEFFTLRTTMRLLIAHCLLLPPPEEWKDNKGAEGILRMHELLVPFSDEAQTHGTENHSDATHRGAICLDTKPSTILIEAYKHAAFLCEREYNIAPGLRVNGLPTKQFLADQHSEGLVMLGETFPYIDIHLYYVFFEVLKNALITSVRKAGLNQKPEPINVSFISGTSLFEENERTVKITDCGEGVHREDIRKVWSYFYSTGKTLAREPEAKNSELAASALHSRGLGLPVSRVLVRYFGGEMDLHSIPRKGTDVYIYL